MLHHSITVFCWNSGALSTKARNSITERQSNIPVFSFCPQKVRYADLQHNVPFTQKNKTRKSDRGASPLWYVHMDLSLACRSTVQSFFVFVTSAFHHTYCAVLCTVRALARTVRTATTPFCLSTFCACVSCSHPITTQRRKFISSTNPRAHAHAREDSFLFHWCNSDQCDATLHFSPFGAKNAPKIRQAQKKKKNGRQR